MEWQICIRRAIDYMEHHLTDDISAQEVADQVYLSPFFLQKGFSVMTGMGISEYIRNRRLYLAACELQNTDNKVIDITLRYGYETPESFLVFVVISNKPACSKQFNSLLSPSSYGLQIVI